MPCGLRPFQEGRWWRNTWYAHREAFTMVDSLQTSPYLTCVLAGRASPIVYAIDEPEPVHPDVTPPEGAVFGVIGLDRTVVWCEDTAALDVLRHAAGRPVAQQDLADEHGADVVSDLVRRNWLQAPDQLCLDYLLTTAQIEVTAHCNWGCAFCPVAVDPKPSATMPMPLFEDILDKLSPYETIRYVTFHFYNEPTLDRLFEDRIAALRSRGLLLRLFTNASNLTDSKIEALRSDVLYKLVVNLPALQEQDFQELTRSRTLAKSLRNLDAAVDAGLPVEITVNGVGDDLMRRLGELRERYEPRGVPVTPTVISDRAGTVPGTYHQAVRIEGPLRGCAWPVNHVHFSVSGEVFICCNDYYQREKFGNIGSGPLDEIMSGPEAVLARRRVFGVADAPDDYLCRSCHDQLLDFPRRQFRPLATFPGDAARPCQGSARG